MGIRKIWALTPVIANVYAHADITRIDYSLVATMSIAACLCIRVFNMVVINGVLNSGGDVKYTMVVNIVCLWGISLPLALFCIKTLGLDIRFVVIAILSEDIVKAILVYFRLRKKMWLKNLVTNMNESC
ncbi:hypothetical protein [Photobacterium profundum]|uniref:Hypothetical membrane protein n=1 Tax=Photobacterium profundum (strain SS9) TaxID=298386 RepID=Q6LH88_PHOPR|nr:hypothetical protein [Photobacterium profundum]CAG23342.1 hypothetical membrane protein [Photobacterium profundum SS9]